MERIKKKLGRGKKLLARGKRVMGKAEAVVAIIKVKNNHGTTTNTFQFGQCRRLHLNISKVITTNYYQFGSRTI